MREPRSTYTQIQRLLNFTKTMQLQIEQIEYSKAAEQQVRSKCKITLALQIIFDCHLHKPLQIASQLRTNVERVERLASYIATRTYYLIVTYTINIIF